MRIYLTGSHAIGKSTIAAHIKQKYKLPMITEAARSILSEHEWSIDSLRADLQKVDQYQKEIFYRQLQEEKKYIGKDFVSDRGFDFLCYTLQHSTVGPEILATQEWKDYLESLKKDDVLILFVRPHKSLLKNDGIRENPNWDGVVAIDAMTKTLLQMYGLKYFQIDCISMQERTNLVDNIIELFLAKEKTEKKKTEKKKTVWVNGFDSLLTKEEWQEEEEKLQKELRAKKKEKVTEVRSGASKDIENAREMLQAELRKKECSGFVKFGEQEKLVDLDWCNDRNNQCVATNLNVQVNKKPIVYGKLEDNNDKFIKKENEKIFLGIDDCIKSDKYVPISFKDGNIYVDFNDKIICYTDAYFIDFNQQFDNCDFIESTKSTINFAPIFTQRENENTPKYRGEF